MQECLMYDGESNTCKSGLATMPDRFCAGLVDKYPTVYKTIFCQDDELPESILDRSTKIWRDIRDA